MNTKLINFARIAKRYFSEESTPSEATALASAAILLTDAKRSLLYNTVTALNDYFKNEGMRETKYPIFLSYLSTPIRKPVKSFSDAVDSQVSAVQIFISMLNGIIARVSKLQGEPFAISVKPDLFRRTLTVSENPFSVSGEIFASKALPHPWKVTANGQVLKLLATNAYNFAINEPVEDAYKDFFYFIVKEVYSFMNITDNDIRESGVGL